MTTATEYTVTLRQPHPAQVGFVESSAKRVIVRSGRRGGKTVGVAIRATKRFLAGRRQLYGAPTQEQVDAFWWEVKRALAPLIDSGVLYKNESLHIIEFPGTKQRIRAKTCWNSDTLRGDYADDLYLDEWQLMAEDTWDRVGAPMLADTDGDAVFIYTPPSLRSRGVSKAKDPRHAAKMFKAAQADITGRWATFHFPSAANPHISQQALTELTSDMTTLGYRQEILAEDVDDVPGALWTYDLIDANRVERAEHLLRMVIGVDPPGGAVECGIVVAAKGQDGHHYVLADGSLLSTPNAWASRILALYQEHRADRVVGEANYGGDMVETTIRNAARAQQIEISYRNVHATRGKAVRAEPIMALYERGLVHHVGLFPALEEEMVTWVPGETARSPNRLDALVWALTELSGRGYSADMAVIQGGKQDSLTGRLGW